MIGKITGRVDLKGADHVLIDTGGVGYIVYCSERTIGALPPGGGEAALYTDLVVREDLLQLFGFLTPIEREWHKLLTSVQGVGAKAALAIQGTLGTEGVSRAIALGDAAAVKAAPGVGPKLAQRVVNELKDKAPALMASPGAGAGAVIAGRSAAPSAALPETRATADAMSALVNLGYPQGEAAEAIARVSEGLPDPETGALIKAALKVLAPDG